MKVLHVNEFFYPNVAGPTRHIEDVVKFTLKPENHSIISFDLCNQLKESDFFCGVPHRRFYPFSRNELHRFLNIGFGTCSNLKLFVDYVRDLKPYCVVLYFVGMLPILISEALPECRVIYMPFGYQEGDYRFSYMKKKFKIALCGDGSVENYIKAGAAPDQLFVVERPIDVHLHTPIPGLRNPFQLLYVGRFHPMKRVPYLVEMIVPLFAEFKELRFTIVADTTFTSYTGAVKEELCKVTDLIKRHNLEERITLKGKLLGPDLLWEYSKASIHLLPSYLDRRNTATQEAITMGLQCINSNKQPYDWPEHTESGEVLIHYVDTVDDFPEKIRKMLKTEHRPSNRNYAIRNWSWEQWAPKYNELFCNW